MTPAEAERLAIESAFALVATAVATGSAGQLRRRLDLAAETARPAFLVHSIH